MKMQYHHKKNNSRRAYVVYGAVVVFVLVISTYVFNMSGIVQRAFLPVRTSAVFMSNAFSSMIGMVRYGDGYEDVVLLKSYERAVERLTDINRTLVLENDMLRRELGLRTADDRDVVSVPVLSHPPLTLFDTIVIDIVDKGRMIVRGQKVFAGERIFAGTIQEVYGRTALVELLSSPGRKTEAIVAHTDIAIVLEGIGGGMFEFIAPETFDIDIGDLVVTPGDIRHIIARVVSKETHVDSSFVTILLEQPFNIRTVQWVHIDIAQ